MKYVIRKGMFETNSSSTHALVLLVGNQDEKGRSLEEVRKEFSEDIFERDVIREIRSKRMKGLFLYQFKFATLTAVYGSIKEYFEGLAERGLDQSDFASLKTFTEEYENILTFKETILDKIGRDEETLHLIKKIEEELPNYYFACNECFWNDVLDSCSCGVDYLYICNRFKIDLDDFKNELHLIDLVLDDDSVFFVACEYWAGGYTFDLPDIL